MAELQTIDPRWFRQVLGRYPTGVAVITAMGAEDKPVGLAVGTFTSVSLDPPLVGFLPDKSSSSWPKIRAAGVFCVNILSHEQEPICRVFATKKPDKFEGLDWHPSEGTGSPILDDVVAWIDCELEAVHDAGDHEIVIGRVKAMRGEEHNLPLVFFEGGYGRFDPLSRAAADADLFEVLRYVDPARPEMERLAEELGLEVVAGALVGGEIVHVAGAGVVREGEVPARIGMRTPNVPPLGMSTVAYGTEEDIEAWLARATPALNDDEKAAWRRALARQRDRGYWVRLGGPTEEEFDERVAQLNAMPAAGERNRAFTQFFEGRLSDEYAQRDLEPAEEYEVRGLSAPIFGPDGAVVFWLVLYGLPEHCTGARVVELADRLKAACGIAAAALGA